MIQLWVVKLVYLFYPKQGQSSFTHGHELHCNYSCKYGIHFSCMFSWTVLFMKLENCNMDVEKTNRVVKSLFRSSSSPFNSSKGVKLMSSTQAVQ
jgi:hypothetical protein